MPRLVFAILALAAIIKSAPLASDEIIPEDDLAEESVMYSSYSSHYSAPMYSSYSSHYSAPMYSSYSSHYSAPMYSSYSSHYSAPTTTPATTTRRTSRRWRRRMEKSLIPHFVKVAAKKCGCMRFDPIPKCIRRHTPKVCKKCGNCIARKLGKQGGWRYTINQLHKVSKRMKRVNAFK